MTISELIEGAGSVCITGHIRPDGDCAGSALALYRYLKRNHQGLDVDVFLELPTAKLSFLSGYNDLNTRYDLDKTYDVMFCLDCASLERCGKAEKYFHSAGKTINIDHHISNPEFAQINYVFPYSSSTCEVLYGFFEPEKIDREIAICLYTGIVYDTGVFKYPATSPQTMRIVADLMEFGIPMDFIIDESFYAKNYDENRIYGYAIMKSKLACDGRVIYSSINKEELKQFGVASRELEGIVEQLRLTRGVKCSFCIHEVNPTEYKVSFRSNGEVDVNKIAEKFGGGGHERAAGANLKGDMDACIARILIEAGKCFN